jgi:hypothetical protein
MTREIDRGGVVRVALDDEVFAALVAGRMATVRGVGADGMVEVEIILSGLGWERMFELIRAAMENRAAPRKSAFPAAVSAEVIWRRS